MTVGLKTLMAVLLAVSALAIGIWRGVFSAEHFVHLSAGTAFAIGLFASACTALVGFGWRPRSRSRTSIALTAPPAIVDDAPSSRELPALAQRGLLVIVFATIALGTLSNEATARIGSVPSGLTKPSRSEYCAPDEPAVADEPEPEPVVEQQQVDQAGCALVKRAYALGYAKSLGSCAPKTITIAPQPKAKAKPVEVCERRQRDEPFLHYAFRKVVATTSAASPGDAVSARIHAVRVRLDYIRDLLADINHAITGTPHASHHLWTDLPDPHPHTFAQRFTGHPPCSSRFADLPLWPGWDASASPSLVFEHVLGQLLFATRFGTTGSCSDYTIHWSAAPDTCAKLAADPESVLSDAGATTSLHAVLDRRRRQLAMRALATQLGETFVLPEPPPAAAVTSVQCLMFDGARPIISKPITVEGEKLLLRELHAAPIVPAGGGPLAVYAALAQLLSGTKYAGPAGSTKIDGPLAKDEPPTEAPTDPSTPPAPPAPDTTPPAPSIPPPPPPPAPAPPKVERVALDAPDFSLLQLEPLVDADPFLTGATPLDRPDLVEVYPLEQHLHAFIDAFRRVYLPQRGRL